MFSHLPVSLPQDTYSASLLGCSRGDIVTERAQFLFGGRQRRLAKPGDGQHCLVAAVESLEELAKILDASLLQGIDGTSSKSQLFDGALGRTLQFFLDLLLLDIGLAGGEFLIETVHLTFDIEDT